MPPTDQTPPAAPPNIADASWLHEPALCAVFDALGADGGEVRVVGGAVRNTLLGRAVTDIDLATTLVPDEVIARARAANLGAHPTGIEHGTVTLVADGQPFEVTTLRRDIDTDGRRAVVRFTASWREDAERRDFTINALYSDRTGRIYDDVGGLADLAARKVRFIGDAEARIREDYLRILRFFRFTAQYAGGDMDREGVQACTSLKAGLAQLSAERVGAEFLKLLAAEAAPAVLTVMAHHTILSSVIGADGFNDRLQHLASLERCLEEPPDVVTRLATLALTTPGDAGALAQRLRLPNAMTHDLRQTLNVAARLASPPDDDTGRTLIYRFGASTFHRAVRHAWAKSGAATDDLSWLKAARLADRWMAPQLPFTGADILALGIKPGPEVGAILKAFESIWITAGFPSDPGINRQMLRDIARRGPG
jgi:poly(A) polymerase